jgi:hypothetical protein
VPIGHSLGRDTVSNTHALQFAHAQVFSSRTYQEPRTHVHFSTARCTRTLCHECIKRVVRIDCAQQCIVSNIEAVSLKARDVV